VRSFFVHNALYWLNEYRFDGLRLDAVHAILDDSATHILSALAAAVRQGCGQGRHVHLVLENVANQARFLLRQPERLYDAQWNDDFHHAAHVVATKEAGGYYSDYSGRPLRAVGRALAEGFIYQGEASTHRGGEKRGEASRDLPLSAFVAFLQNHDQIGNRALGERLGQLAGADALRALQSILLLAPHVPMLFMGEEWNAPEPFLFFCDFAGDLADAVREGRRREFAKFPAFSDPAMRERIPDPNDPATFHRSTLDWSRITEPAHAGQVIFITELLALRRRQIVPRLDAAVTDAAFAVSQAGALGVAWRLGDGTTLSLQANLGDTPILPAPPPDGRLLFTTHPEHAEAPAMPAWCVRWHLAEAGGSP
jgi:malto-oligosyltrehalose trehalohydrolase